MTWCVVFIMVIFCNVVISTQAVTSKTMNNNNQVSTWFGSWNIFPTSASWSLQTRIPMTAGKCIFRSFSSFYLVEAKCSLAFMRKFLAHSFSLVN